MTEAGKMPWSLEVDEDGAPEALTWSCRILTAPPTVHTPARSHGNDADYCSDTNPYRTGLPRYGELRRFSRSPKEEKKKGKEFVPFATLSEASPLLKVAAAVCVFSLVKFSWSVCTLVPRGS